MAIRELIIDAYAALSYKTPLEQPFRVAPTWVPIGDRRRIAAYAVLAAYQSNVGREYLKSQDEADRASHREYGDAQLLVERTVAGVLGDEVQIVVDGADTDLPESPLLPDEPEAPPADAAPIEQRAHEAQRRIYERRAQDAIDAWEADWEAQPGLIARQDWLRAWADSELLDQKLWEGENNTVGLGDGIYVLAWSARAQRPIVRVYDPGFYFPVLDDEAAHLGYPATVHLAWEEDRDGDGIPDVVRRITWRLAPIRPRLDETGVPMFEEETGRLVLTDGDRLDPATGRIVRRYPWAPDVDSATTCYLTDATWPLANANGIAVTAFDETAAVYGVNEDGEQFRDLDLRVDFIPVVHVPNTPASQEHFGRSALARVLQLLDDIADTDSDLQAAAALAGTPMLGIAGAAVPASLSVAPGAVIGLGDKGSITSVDLSASVTALRDVAKDLRDLLSVNSQVAASVLGRVEPSEISSGVEMALHMAPFRSLIAVLRLVRDQKGRLLLKFVQRLAQAGGILEAGEPPAARLQFGSFLPEDRKALIDEVVALVGGNLLSRSSGLRLLVAGGIEIGDIADELLRAQGEDFEGAVRLLDATGDEDAVRAYLGLAGQSPNPEPPPPPAPTLNLG